MRDWPDNQSVLHKVVPVYEELPGWQTDLSAATEAHELPDAARRYVAFLEEQVGGADRAHRRRPRPRSVRLLRGPGIGWPPGGDDPVAPVKVVVVGSGGREHALAAVLGRTADVVVTPGNPGIPGSTAAPPEELDADLFVIGPEAPLVDGLADRLRAAGRRVFGPGADGARLEGSKGWMKELVATAGVPTAAHGAFTETWAALAFLRSWPRRTWSRPTGWPPARACWSPPIADEAEDDVLAKLSGAAVRRRRSHRRHRGGADAGPSCPSWPCATAPAPSRWRPPRTSSGRSTAMPGPTPEGWAPTRPCRSRATIWSTTSWTASSSPTMLALRGEGIDYRGTLYAGLMLTADGPKLLEYNVRFGDPEAQVVLPRLRRRPRRTAGGGGRRRPDGRARPRCSSTTRPCASCSPRPATPMRRRTGAVIDGLDAAAGRRRRRVLRRRRSPTPTAGWSPPAGGCSTWSGSGPTHRRRPGSAPTPGPTACRFPGMQFRTRHRRGGGQGGDSEGRRAHGLAERPRQDAAGRRHAGPLRHRSRRAGAVGPPHAGRGGRVRQRRPARSGYAAVICGAGMAAHLAGAVAANTTLPVVGVPLSGGALNGVDALYATVQMPRGIPVATVAVDGAMNAALLVVQMLAISDEALAAAAGRRPRRAADRLRARLRRPSDVRRSVVVEAGDPSRGRSRPRRAGPVARSGQTSAVGRASAALAFAYADASGLAGSAIGRATGVERRWPVCRRPPPRTGCRTAASSRRRRTRGSRRRTRARTSRRCLGQFEG